MKSVTQNVNELPHRHVSGNQESITKEQRKRYNGDAKLIISISTKNWQHKFKLYSIDLEEYSNLSLLPYQTQCSNAQKYVVDSSSNAKVVPHKIRNFGKRQSFFTKQVSPCLPNTSIHLPKSLASLIKIP